MTTQYKVIGGLSKGNWTDLEELLNKASVEGWRLTHMRNGRRSTFVIVLEREV